MEKFETVIVGGGITGVALAYYLAKAGMDDILLVERAELASGSTGGSMGGVRQQFGTPHQVELAKRGRTFWSTFEDNFDHPCPYWQDGYLMFSGNEATHQMLVDSAAVQVAAGAPDVELLDAKQLRELLPWLNTEGVIGGAWTPLDGHVNPTDGLYGLAAEARKMGVTIRQDTPVFGFAANDGGWQVESATPVWGKKVVIAAGLGSPDLVRPFGVDLPITPFYVHYGYTTPVLQGERLPLTIDLDTGFCVERESDGAIVSMLSSEADLSYTANDMLADFAEEAEKRAPIFTEVSIRHTTTAAADSTGGDGNPFIGPLEDGLWTMTGFDGHGTMMGAPVAELTANLMLGTSDPVIDTSLFDPRREPNMEHREWLRASRKDPAGA